jgi:hypothetical protein
MNLPMVPAPSPRLLLLVAITTTLALLAPKSLTAASSANVMSTANPTVYGDKSCRIIGGSMHRNSATADVRAPT